MARKRMMTKIVKFRVPVARKPRKSKKKKGRKGKKGRRGKKGRKGGMRHPASRYGALYCPAHRGYGSDSD